MLSSLAVAVLAFVVSSLVTWASVPSVSRLATRLRAVDVPGPRRRHRGERPRLGGIAIATGIASGFLVGTIASGLAVEPVLQPSWTVTGPFVVAWLVILAMGVLDDIRPLAARWKLLVQVVSASLIAALGWTVEVVQLPWGETFELGFFAPVVTVLWIVAVTNAINLIDGLDALAGGVVAIVSVSLLAFALMLGAGDKMLAAATISGACLGFLRYNWAPARIFMGDAGSQTLGFSLGVLSLHFSLKTTTAVVILVPVLALGIPMIDVALVMLIRALEAPQATIWTRLRRVVRADRLHLHHLLEGMAHRRVVPLLYGLILVSCGLAMVVAVVRSWQLGLAFLVLEVGVVVGIRRAGMRRLAELEAAETRRRALAELEGSSAGGPGAPERRREGGEVSL